MSSPSNGERDETQRAHLERFRAYIEERLADMDFTLQEVACAFRLSDRYVRRVFASAHESPSGFIRRRRLDLAARMLLDPQRGHLTILAIALDCGFTSAAHFSRSFHEHFGATPRTFRKRTSISAGIDAVSGAPAPVGPSHAIRAQRPRPAPRAPEVSRAVLPDRNDPRPHRR